MPVIPYSDRGFAPPTPACTSVDTETGLQCTQEEGHYPPHRAIVEWTDDADATRL